MNLEYEDHILYKNGKYESLSRIDNYIKSRIKGEGDMGDHA